MSPSYLRSSRRAIARSSWETAETAWEMLLSRCGLSERPWASLESLLDAPFLSSPDAERFFTCEYLAGIGTGRDIRTAAWCD